MSTEQPRGVDAKVERMLSGAVYDAADPELYSQQRARLELLHDYNATRPSQHARRTELLKSMLAQVGEGSAIEPPFHANWGGLRVCLGVGVWANFGLTLVDEVEISIGNRTMIGPNVVISTAGHPVLPELRAHGAQFNLPVVIGSDVWIGAGALILPGVTIGDGSVIGAGSVVTRDVPAGVVAVGSPCQVVREIGEYDREYYARGRRFDQQPPGALVPQ